MEENELKSLWNMAAPDKKTSEEIIYMLEEKHHPVLKGIRIQITIEIVSWSAFMLCYFSAFDGAEKPGYINLILIFSVLVPLIHNIYGYRLTNQMVDSPTLLSSLKKRIKDTKIYGLRSIITRTVFTLGLMIFFSYNVNFTPSRFYLVVGAIIALTIIQVFLLSKIWSSRVKKLKEALAGFD
ncbi:hypothetical protein ACVWYN_002973 [Pedobacter sp. UYP24]